MTVANPDTLEMIRDGVKGTRAFGLTASDITGTTPVVCIAAPAAGYHLEVRQIRVINKTAAETPIIVMEDTSGTPVEFWYDRLGGLADASSKSDTGWLNQPIHITSAKGVNFKATTATGDCRAMVWADVVAD